MVAAIKEAFFPRWRNLYPCFPITYVQDVPWWPNFWYNTGKIISIVNSEITLNWRQREWFNIVLWMLMFYLIYKNLAPFPLLVIFSVKIITEMSMCYWIYSGKCRSALYPFNILYIEINNTQVEFRGRASNTQPFKSFPLAYRVPDGGRECKGRACHRIQAYGDPLGMAVGSKRMSED